GGLSPMLTRLAAEKASGVLVRERGTLYLAEGRVVHAESPLAPGLDTLLTAYGTLTAEAWTAATKEDDAEPAIPAVWDPSALHAGGVPCVAADDGNRILAVNRAAAALLGWDADVLVGRRLTVLIPPEWRERHVAGFTSLLLTGESRILGRPVRVEALHRDGHTIPVDLLIHAQEAREGRTVFVAELSVPEQRAGSA
ncbi:PAS domain S-box protein, partial [Streptomyces carpinensis]